MIYQQLSREYGWTPDQINNLTLFQVAVYLGGITPEHGRVKMNMQDSMHYVEHLKTSGY